MLYIKALVRELRHAQTREKDGEMAILEIADDLLQRYEDALDPAQPESGEIQVQILGYGEMSTVLAFDEPGYEGYAFKRMALFHADAEVDAYEALYTAYNKALESHGIEVPDYGVNRIGSRDGEIVLYLSQHKLAPESIGNKLLHLLPDEDLMRLIEHVMTAGLRVFAHNWKVQAGEAQGAELGLDMQISNWAVHGVDPQNPRLEETPRLQYLDTNTPLMRIDGIQQLNPELFLRICPSYLVWIIRLFFLKDVIRRYFDFRAVCVDLLANFIKEGRDDLLPAATETVNTFLRERITAQTLAPIREKEVRSYYREDAWIWRLFLAFRRLERYIKTNIQRKRYNIILPGKIKR